MTPHQHLKRLPSYWSSHPILFITTRTAQYRKILTQPEIASILIEEWTGALDRHGWQVGRYVVMPDHVHFFCAPAGLANQAAKPLSAFMQQWKQWTSKRILRETTHHGAAWQAPIWQAEFFDHVLRSEESYTQKWQYVRENPVRAELVKHPDDWVWQGEIFEL